MALEPPPEEVCDGADNDCDGVADEDFDCTADSVGHCAVIPGEVGVGQCGRDCTWARCEPTLGEFCNGRDDDGDGAVDEGFQCSLWTTSECGDPELPGLRQCTAACRWGGCQVPEVCNYHDDNGNGLIDEGVDYVDQVGRRIADGSPDVLRFAGAFCGGERIAVLSFTGDHMIRVFRADGSAVSPAWQVCGGQARPFDSEPPWLDWIGDDLVVMCNVDADQVTLQRYSQSGEPRSPVVRREHVPFAPFHVAARDGSIAIAYAQHLAGRVQVVLEELAPDLDSIAGPLLAGVRPQRGEGLRFDAINSILLHDDAGTVLFVTNAEGLTEKYDVDFAAEEIEYHFHLPYSWLGQVRRLRDGYAVFGLGFSTLAVLDGNGVVVGVPIVAAGADGVAAQNNSFVTLEREAAFGVSRGQIHVGWPPERAYTRVSIAGRLANTSKPHFGGAIPPEAEVAVGCVLDNGPLVLIWAGGPGAEERRWMSAFGCPEEV